MYYFIILYLKKMSYLELHRSLHIRSRLLTHICIPVVFDNFSQLKMARHDSDLMRYTYFLSEHNQLIMAEQKQAHQDYTVYMGIASV